MDGTHRRGLRWTPLLTEVWELDASCDYAFLMDEIKVRGNMFRGTCYGESQGAFKWLNGAEWYIGQVT